MADQQDTTLPDEQPPVTPSPETTTADEQDTASPVEQPPADEQDTTLPDDETTLPNDEKTMSDEEEEDDTLPDETTKADDEQETTLPNDEKTMADDEQDTTLLNETTTNADDEQETTLPDETTTKADDEQETTLPVETTKADEQDTTLPVEQPPVIQEEEKAQQLKYLEFVKGIAIYAIVCFITLYEYAKDNSGPLKSGVNAVEGSVKTVTRPVYNKFHLVPLQLLQFIDCKIGETVIELDHRMPAMVTRACSQLLLVAQKTPEVAREVVSEVEQAGLVDATSNIVKRVYANYEPAAKELYNKYEPVAEKYAVSTWSKLNQLPLFPIVAHIVIPTAAYWAEKYNQLVATIVERGYTVSCYLPLIPIDKIAKAFENNGDVHTASSDDDYVALTQ